MIAIPLQSGSNGNCIYVEAGGARFLFDAGISLRQAQLRLAEFGIDVAGINAVFISHDHSDHTRSACTIARKHGLPLHMTEGTRHACGIELDSGPQVFDAGETIYVASAAIHTVPTPHDAQDGVAFVVEAEGKRLGILTDLGHVFEGLPETISQLDGVFLESNYDPQMLQNGTYPWHLKQRIMGPGGHLSNLEAAELLSESGQHLQWACLSHLSQHNNEPTLALETHREIVRSDLPLYVASRVKATGVFRL